MLDGSVAVAEAASPVPAVVHLTLGDAFNESVEKVCCQVERKAAIDAAWFFDWH
jgi:hypothetical protein